MMMIENESRWQGMTCGVYEVCWDGWKNDLESRKKVEEENKDEWDDKTP